MGNGSLEGPRLKLARASKHLQHLEVACDEFIESDPYGVRIGDNPATGKREHRVVRVIDPPADLSIIAGDVVHNLRSALDHLIWQLVLANGGEPEELRTEFPIWRSKDLFDSHGPGGAKGIGPAALNLLSGLKPYKGGNEALWRLHKLDIVDKHRLVLAVVAAQQSVFVDLDTQMRKHIEANRPEEIEAAFPPIDPLEINVADRQVIEVGTVLMEEEPGGESDETVEFRVQIALNEAEVRPGEPLVPALSELGRVVAGTLDTFAPLLA